MRARDFTTQRDTMPTDHLLQHKQHGGRRPNQTGRPSKVPDQKKVKHSVSLSPENHAYILSRQRPHETYSATLDRILTERRHDD